MSNPGVKTCHKMYIYHQIGDICIIEKTTSNQFFICEPQCTLLGILGSPVLGGGAASIIKIGDLTK